MNLQGGEVGILCTQFLEPLNAWTSKLCTIGDNSEENICNYKS